MHAMSWQRQKGYSLIEMILVVGLLALGSVLAMAEKQTELDQLMAKNTGNQLHIYNSAVRAWLSDHPESTMAPYTGTRWLKPVSCGGPNTVEYLPCDFPSATAAEPIRFGELVLTTEIITNPLTKVTRVETSATPFTVLGKLRAELAGLAAITAAAGGMEASTPITQATGGAFKSDPATGVITMVASNNASQDAWLRTDGSNEMEASIRFNPSALNRQIENVSRLQNMVGQILYIGNPGGASAAIAQRVVVDADETLLGQLVISNIKNQATGLQVARGDLVISNGDLDVSGSATARRFIDKDNPAYAVDPASTSRVNALNADGIVRSNSSVRAPIFYDQDDTSFYLDPASSSRLQELRAVGRITAGDHIQLEKVETLGASCSSNGLLARDNKGMLLSCQEGTWKSGAGSQGQLVTLCSMCYASYSGVNNTGKIMMVTAYYGKVMLNNNYNEDQNVFDLRGSVGGTTVVRSYTANRAYSKQTSISFFVPAGSTFAITSSPPNQSSGPGYFYAHAVY